MIKIQENDILLFIGDSITDAGRRDYFKADLGQGYVNMIAGQLFRQFFHYNLTIINRGVGGDKLIDLARRWQKDCLDYTPTIVTIQIGINDVWHHLDTQDILNAAYFKTYEDNYRALIDSLHQLPSVREIVLIEPFLLAGPTYPDSFRTNLDQLRKITANLANSAQITLVKTDTILNRLGKGLGWHYVAGDDGVHPTSFGHAHLAERWFVATQL